MEPPLLEDTMKPIWILSFLALALVAGCRNNMVNPDVIPPVPPSGLRTATGDNFIELFWNTNSEADVAGYNVFVSASYNGPYDLLGSTRSNYFLDNGAQNGSTYYYAVTAYDYDGNESDLSKDVAYDVPRPEGYNVVLSEFNRTPDLAGYDFSTYSVISFDASGADMYFENYNGTLYMDVYTDTDIQDMGPTGSILDINEAPASGWSSTHDAVLQVGHTYVVWTHDDHYAKFRVSTLSSGRVVFDWAYQLQKSNPMLKRPASAANRSTITHAGHGH
jgi:hypothetical protein